MLEAYIKSLAETIDKLETLEEKLENNIDYKDDLVSCINAVNDTIGMLFRLFTDDIAAQVGFKKEYIIQILKDWMDGIENNDRVLLLDTMRYGLIEEFDRDISILTEIEKAMEDNK